MGKTRIIAETGAGQHGVAVATVCARFGLPCEIFMGAVDVARQSPNVFRMKLLGAKVNAVTSGAQTLKDAMNEALRDWVTNVHDTYYLIGTAAGPHPYPAMVRDFQSVIGNEVREQMQAAEGRLPDTLVACIGGGSNAIGLFHPFLDDESVKIYGVEAGGRGLDVENGHCASMTGGKPGVLHGNRTYLLQNADGQILEGHSISAGLDYPGVGPEHSWLKDSGRVTYVADHRQGGAGGLPALHQDRGHHPGAGAGARAGVRGQARADAAQGQSAGHEHVRPRRQGHLRRRRPPRHEDVAATICRLGKRSRHDSQSRIDRRFAALKAEGRKALVTFVTAGDPDYTTAKNILFGLPAAGADIIELGMPFSDPMADGPAVQASSLRALKAGHTMQRTLDLVHAFRVQDQDTPIVLMGYYNPIYIYPRERFLDEAVAAGVDGLIIVDVPPEADEELCLPAIERGLNFIRLATPTTDAKRLPAVLANTSGFLYYVSITGITGAAAPDVAGRSQPSRAHQEIDLPSRRGGLWHPNSGAGQGHCRRRGRGRGGICAGRSDP